ncbi:MAG TPA: antitoxin Xre/MbcA/ParS toxin-binding domain-containing protein [Rhodanobacteraceae bacterium]|nr:antitoxin Xre/MbcA/ParS toxin-binding domain-containing protein [Rhodanobacteraceae bacterium]
MKMGNPGLPVETLLLVPIAMALVAAPVVWWMHRANQRDVARAERVARVLAEAIALFGSEEAARVWMNTPGEFAPGQPPVTPAELAASEAGARLLEERIRRTTHGVF